MVPFCVAPAPGHLQRRLVLPSPTALLTDAFWSSEIHIAEGGLGPIVLNSLQESSVGMAASIARSHVPLIAPFLSGLPLIPKTSLLA